ncbi:hypothetical protein VV867_27510 [Pseudomonas sp. JH-2]|uniref:hypothetical protein n=1 Tax=Pseudomonas sp. JH-2 TaxID=3114998 RepID=UPI002E266D95|nr:hypothetical protein [Pseudomonas sp. JH-2]
MLSSSPHTLIKVTRGWLFLLAILLASLCLILPIMVAPSFVAFVLAACWRARDVYLSDSYSDYCGLMLFQGLSILPFLSLLLVTLLGTRDLGWSPMASLALGCIPALLTLATYQQAKRSKAAPLPYDIRDGRVHPRARQHRKVNLLWLAAAIGAMSVLMPQVRGASATPLILLAVTSTLAVVMTLSVRQTIAAFAQLREAERKNGVRYLFGNLEEIHAWRSRSYTARLFARLDNALGKRRG